MREVESEKKGGWVYSRFYYCVFLALGWLAFSLIPHFFWTPSAALVAVNTVSMRVTFVFPSEACVRVAFVVGVPLSFPLPFFYKRP